MTRVEAGRRAAARERGWGPHVGGPAGYLAGPSPAWRGACDLAARPGGCSLRGRPCAQPPPGPTLELLGQQNRTLSWTSLSYLPQCGPSLPDFSLMPTFCFNSKVPPMKTCMKPCLGASACAGHPSRSSLAAPPRPPFWEGHPPEDAAWAALGPDGSQDYQGLAREAVLFIFHQNPPWIYSRKAKGGKSGGRPGEGRVC